MLNLEYEESPNLLFQNRTRLSSPAAPWFSFHSNNFQRAIVYINPNWRNKNIFLHEQTIILFFYKNIDKILTYSKLTSFYKLSATILLLIVTGTTKSTSRVRVENGAIHLGWSSSISAFHMKTKPTAIGEKYAKSMWQKINCYDTPSYPFVLLTMFCNLFLMMGFGVLIGQREVCSMTYCQKSSAWGFLLSVCVHAVLIKI